MPPDRFRGITPHGRQKSCAECAKAKRRCDLEHPSCARCRKQHLACVYPQLRAQVPVMASQHTTLDTQNEFELPDLSMDSQDIGGTVFPLNLDATFFPAPIADTLDFDCSTGVSSLESLSIMLNNSSNEEDQMAVQRSFCLDTKPFSQAHIAPFAKSRIEYSIEQLKLVPKTMIEQNCTPWTHHKLYEEFMPRPLQDAYAACALYITRNDTNVEHVTRYITQRVEEVSTSTLPTEPIQILARAHALMLYQIMLVFGGDIRVYAQAEALIPNLEEVGERLLTISRQHNDTPGALPLYPSTSARSAWRSYVFCESVRRTVLSLFQFTTMCNLLRGQLTSCRSAISQGNRVTLSAHLWNSNDTFDFTVAWNDKKHFLVKDLDFTEVLRDAKPDDIDIFGRMMMVGLQGIDDIRGWFYTRGGKL